MYYLCAYLIVLSKRDNTLSKSDNTLSRLDNMKRYVFREYEIRREI